jgi:hypothetical protein
MISREIASGPYRAISSAGVTTTRRLQGMHMPKKSQCDACWLARVGSGPGSERLGMMRGASKTANASQGREHIWRDAFHFPPSSSPTPRDEAGLARE